MNRLGISNESYFTNFVYRGPKMLEKQGKWLTGSPVAEQFKKHKNILKLKVIKNLSYNTCGTHTLSDTNYSGEQLF